MSAVLSRLKRGLQKPPRVIARRLWMEMRRSMDRVLPLQLTVVTPRSLLRQSGDSSIDEMWERLARRPYLQLSSPGLDRIEEFCPGETERVLNAAARCARHEVDLLGSGSVLLGDRIDWHRDYKSEYSWPMRYAADLDYVNRGRRSDVKFPWELSRLQWLIPVGQAYRLTGDDSWAAVARDVLNQWMERNPCGYGVNWSCTMEAALRIFSWTSLFHSCWDSPAWSEKRFRERFLSTLFQHGRFTDSYLEYSDINGNHCTADAAALVWGGLFFGEGSAPRHWLEKGWNLLTEELPRQVTPDGVNFEGSIPYHRLVTELFFLAARYRELFGFETPPLYRERVIAMGGFTRACIGPDGKVPVWGDADDGRVLPCGNQDLNDHRYLPASIGATWGQSKLLGVLPESLNEIFWLLGVEACQQLKNASSPTIPDSVSFRDGGYFILQNSRDHIFIDCAPVGLAGRGGHGHNDALAFEALLDGCRLIVDRGAYAYTLDFLSRNEFRGTNSHNTPVIDGVEINRIDGGDLWNLGYEAVPRIQKWEPRGDVAIFQGSHEGYLKLKTGIVPLRTIELWHKYHTLRVHDDFQGEVNAEFDFSCTWTLAPSVSVKSVDEHSVTLETQGKWFVLSWSSSADWKLSQRNTTVSPSYGVLVPSQKLVWERRGKPAALTVLLHPAEVLLPEGLHQDLRSLSVMAPHLVSERTDSPLLRTGGGT